MRFLHDFIVKVNPEPHRRAFLKPFVKEQAADFCSTCHKVHLDVPVNGYRWIRGFNDYDNWQASGVSGMGARSFYYPPKSQRCVDCHMPKVASNDFGNKMGLVASHRFPAANTALPTANEDAEQLQATEAVSEGRRHRRRLRHRPGAREDRRLDAAWRRSVDHLRCRRGKQYRSAWRPAATASPCSRSPRRSIAWTRPCGAATRSAWTSSCARARSATSSRAARWTRSTCGSSCRRSTSRGQTSSGAARSDDGGNGPVEKGAHFYKSLQIDGNGNVIDKRNAWSTRSVVYVKLIPPGAADTVHYRLQIPETAGDHITLKAKLNYRKFQWINTQFAFAGEPDAHSPDPRVTPDFDNRALHLHGRHVHGVGEGQADPGPADLRRLVAEASLRVLPKTAPPPEPKVVLKPEDWTRWNDYGIGFLLQGDLKHAQAAFTRVTEIEPKNPDGWVNIGRVRVQEGNVAGAREVLEQRAGPGAGPGARELLHVARRESRGQPRASLRPCRKSSRSIRKIASSATMPGATCSCCGGIERRSSSSTRR